MARPITDLIHHPYLPPEGFEAPQPGVFKASTVYFPSVAAMRSREWKDKSAYTYGLHGTPTSYLLDDKGQLQKTLVGELDEHKLAALRAWAATQASSARP